MVLTIRMPTFGTRRVAWSQKWNHLSKNTGSFENISRTKLFGTKVHYKREVETWYSTRFTVLIDFFAKQNSRRIGFFFASADSTTRFWEECRSMSHVMWSFSFSYQSILVGTFSLRLKKSFIRLGTLKTVLRIVSTQDFFSRSWKSAKWHDYDELYFLPKLDETSRRLKLPHSKVQDEVPSIHWNQWHPENSVRSLSWIIRHSLPTNKLFCCKLDCWTKFNISHALLFKANGSTWPNESCHKRCCANLSVVWDVWNWCTDGKCALSKEGYYFLPQMCLCAHNIFRQRHNEE